MEQTFIIALGVLLGCLIALSWFAGSEAPYVPTKIDDLKDFLKKAGLKKGQIFYELGSGDGRLVIAAAEIGAEAHGVEQSWLRVWYSRYQARKRKLKNCHFYHGNIFDRQYFPADVVYIFLLQKAVERLEIKLAEELKEGAIIITQTFHFKDWQPFKKIDLTGSKKVALGKNKYAGDFWIYKK